MDNVVFVLGAGFSAPLGIPVTSNFLVSAQDMYLRDHEKYEHFDAIFEMARHLGTIKSYVASDQLNIEEILSIIEMQGDIRESDMRDRFVRFLCDVINFYMPEWKAGESCNHTSTGWREAIWGSGMRAQSYGQFVGSLLGLSLLGTPDRPDARRVESYGHCEARYSVITFNYDRVLETLCDNASSFLGEETAVAFRVGAAIGDVAFAAQPSLIKIHGDIEAGSVVPPTWSKGASYPVLEAWTQAYAALSQADRIRFLGYSLPSGDEYFRYLMKAAFSSGRYRKEIDVMCLDPDGAVQTRYREFFTFPKLRFANEDLLLYFRQIEESRRAGLGERNANPRYSFKWLETAHQNFFKRA